MQAKILIALCGLLVPLAGAAADKPTQQAALPIVKLTPTAREQPLAVRIPRIPLDAIRQFISEHRITEDKLDDAPLVVGFAGEHITASTGDRVYVRGLGDSADDRYTLVRPGREYRDPETNNLLGYEATFVGDALVESSDEEKGTTTLLVTRNTREVLLSDRLVPVEEEKTRSAFTPKKAPAGIEGRIVNVVDGVSQIGQYQTVLINQGANESLEPGHLLTAARNRQQDFPAASANQDLPNETGGTVMVFRVFETVSYGLVMAAQDNLTINDIVHTPD